MKTTKQMLRIQFLSCALLLSGASAPYATAGADDHAATRDLIEIVNQDSDPSKTGPYAMTVKVVFNPGKREQQIGELKFYRDLSRLRSELQLGNYNEVHIRDGNKHYIARSQPFPIPGTNTFSFPDRLWKINIPPHAKLSALENTKLGSAEVQCFSIKDVRHHDWETRYCVDAQSKLLLESRTRFETIRLSGYAGVGEGYLPTSILVDNGEPKRRVELQDAQIRKLIPQPETFAAPQGAREFETCDHIQGGDFIKRVEPVYPHGDLAKGNYPVATIFFHGVVEKDGSFTDVHVFSPEGSAFEKAGREAAAQWRFTPGNCDGHAVAAEQDTIITLVPH